CSSRDQSAAICDDPFIAPRQHKRLVESDWHALESPHAIRWTRCNPGDGHHATRLWGAQTNLQDIRSVATPFLGRDDTKFAAFAWPQFRQPRAQFDVAVFFGNDWLGDCVPGHDAHQASRAEPRES